MLYKQTGVTRFLKRHEGDPESHEEIERGLGSFGEIVSDLSLFGADERFAVTIPVSTGPGISPGELVRAIKLGSFEDLAVIVAGLGIRIVNSADWRSFGDILFRWHAAAEIGVSLLRPSDLVTEVLSRLPMMIATYLNNRNMARQAQVDAGNNVAAQAAQDGIDAVIGYLSHMEPEVRALILVDPNTGQPRPEDLTGLGGAPRVFDTPSIALASGRVAYVRSKPLVGSTRTADYTVPGITGKLGAFPRVLELDFPALQVAMRILGDPTSVTVEDAQMVGRSLVTEGILRGLVRGWPLRLFH